MSENGVIWNERFSRVETQIASGDGALTLTVGATITSNPSGTLTRFTSNDHGFAANSQLFFAGFTGDLIGFNGLHTLEAVATNTFDLDIGEAVIDTPGGSETGTVILAPGEDFQMLEARLHLSDTGAAENYTITLDSEHGSAFDVVLATHAMSGETDVNDVWGIDEPRYFNSGDALIFAHTNTNARTFGLEIKYQVRR